MYQSIQIIGNLGSDIELRYTPAGTAVATFRMAANEKYTVDGEKREKVVWFRVTLWKTDAENAAKYLTKGSQVMVVGQMEAPNAYVNKSGEPAASNEVTCRTIKYLSKGGANGSNEANATPATDDGSIPF